MSSYTLQSEPLSFGETYESICVGIAVNYLRISNFTCSILPLTLPSPQGEGTNFKEILWVKFAKLFYLQQLTPQNDVA